MQENNPTNTKTRRPTMTQQPTFRTEALPLQCECEQQSAHAQPGGAGPRSSLRANSVTHAATDLKEKAQWTGSAHHSKTTLSPVATACRSVALHRCGFAPENFQTHSSFYEFKIIEKCSGSKRKRKTPESNGPRQARAPRRTKIP